MSKLCSRFLKCSRSKGFRNIGNESIGWNDDWVGIGDIAATTTTAAAA